MIVVSDTSPLLNLIAIQNLKLLKVLYGSVLIPEVVYDELKVNESARQVIDEGINNGDFKVVPSNEISLRTDLPRQLHGGESQAISLYLNLQADLLLIDEKKGRNVAQNLFISVKGTIGVLIDAKRNHLIPEIIPLIDELIAKLHFRIDHELYNEIKVRFDQVD